MGVRLHVEIPAHSLELTLAEVHSLRANLPRRPKVSPVALLRACYARLHGVDPATCSHAFEELHRLAWSNFKRSVDAVLGSGVLGAAPRAHTQRVCARVPPFRALVPLAGALLDMSLPLYYRVAAFEQFTNGTREPSRARARRQAHARRPA